MRKEYCNHHPNNCRFENNIYASMFKIEQFNLTTKIRASRLRIMIFRKRERDRICLVGYRYTGLILENPTVFPLIYARISISGLLGKLMARLPQPVEQSE